MLNLPFHKRALYLYTKRFISIVSTTYIAHLMTDICYQTKKVLASRKQCNEVYLFDENLTKNQTFKEMLKSIPIEVAHMIHHVMCEQRARLYTLYMK